MYIYVYLKYYKNWSSLVIEVNFNEIESIFISNYQVSIEKVVKLYFIDVETWKTIVNLQQIYADNSRSREGFIRVKLGQSIRFRPRLKREMRCSEIFGIRLFAREMKRNDHFPAEWISSFESNEN